MAKQARNPMFDWDVSKFADVQKLTEQFAVPGVDSTVLIESQRKNIETLTAANRAAYEGAQAMAFTGNCGARHEAGPKDNEWGFK